MKHPYSIIAVCLAALSSGCAYDSGDRYPGTAAGSSGTGVIAPGQVVVSAPAAIAFGTPSNLPDPIRAPATDKIAFGTPVDMDALYGYGDQGRMGMAEGDAAKAGFNFERALEVNPFDPVALNNLAVARAEQGQFYEAMALLERAARLAPDNSDIVANLARLRGYVQSYATAGAEPSGMGASKSPAGSLPPAPPMLWSTVSYVPLNTPPPRALAQPPSMARPGDNYVSDACRRVSGKGDKVEVICEPAR